jgi:L-aspartate oxidase
VVFPCATENDMRRLAWEKCGLVRSGEGLREAAESFASITTQPQTGAGAAGYELRNIHCVALLIARCALAREESRGGHYREDFPAKRPEFQKHSLISQTLEESRFV